MKRLKGPSFDFLNMGLPRDLQQLFIVALTLLDKQVIHVAYTGKNGQVFGSVKILDEQARAAYNGAIGRLQWIQDDLKFKVDPSTYFHATAGNQVYVIAWLTSQGIYPGSFATQGAVKAGTREAIYSNTIVAIPVLQLALLGTVCCNFAVSTHMCCLCHAIETRGNQRDVCNVIWEQILDHYHSIPSKVI